MDTRSKFEKEIIAAFKLEHADGYVRDYRHNVLDFVQTSDFEQDLMVGAGKELTSKFSAIYSSSACVVNNFTPIKKNLGKITFLGHKDFSVATFERRLRSGLAGTPPTLDFCLESQNTLIGIESKYLETLRAKKAEFSKSYQDSKIIKDPFTKLINKYEGKRGYLDAAQLIKHSLGLTKYALENSKKCILLYIYWQPVNGKAFKEFQSHDRELTEFTKDMEDISSLSFKSMQYQDYWKEFENDRIIGNDIKKVIARYQIAIN